ncbi:MAG: methionyl-tRNA formyltransferase [Cyclobacteriaceae bacterium]
MRIVFMGTPEFAVPSLQILVENGFNVVGVVTAPDKPQGRGKKMRGSAVKEYAVSKGLKILQPTNLKSEEFLETLRALQADLQIIVAFRMLPEVVWSMPPKGTFNLHGSLLPQYRGAAPINWAIINGEVETGVTTFFLKHEIDTGNIIFQEKEEILPEDNVRTLYERLMVLGAKLVLKTVKAIEEDNYTLSEQGNSGDLKSAPKIHKETCKIDWALNGNQVVDFVRGLSPYPSAWAVFNEKKYKIYKVSKFDANDSYELAAVGDYQVIDKKQILVKVADGLVSIDELQPEGKRRMTAEDFLRGNQF